MPQASAEKFMHSRPTEKKGVASVPHRKQLESIPCRLYQKEKEQSRLSRSPDHEVRDSQGEQELYLGEI